MPYVVVVCECLTEGGRGRGSVPANEGERRVGQNSNGEGPFSGLRQADSHSLPGKKNYGAH